MKRQVFKNLLLSVSFLLSSCASTSFYANECRRYLEAGDYQRAIQRGKEAIDAYAKNTEPYLCVSTAYLQMGHLEKAIDILKEAERQAPSYEDLALIYNKLGFLYHLKGDLDLALTYHQKHLLVSHELSDTKGESTALANMADIYESKGDYTKALFYYNKSVEISTDPADITFAYTNMARIYQKKGEKEKALENYLKAYTYAKKTNDRKLIAVSLINVGDAYRLVKDFKSASEYLISGLELAKQEKDKKLQAYAYTRLGFLYRDKGDRRTAKEFLKRAYDMYISIKDESGAKDALSEIRKLEGR